MTKKVTNLFTAATNNLLFRKDLSKHEPNYSNPFENWSDAEKITYAAIYMGWLIALGQYKESDYK